MELKNADDLSVYHGKILSSLMTRKSSAIELLDFVRDLYYLYTIYQFSSFGIGSPLQHNIYYALMFTATFIVFQA